MEIGFHLLRKQMQAIHGTLLHGIRIGEVERE